MSDNVLQLLCSPCLNIKAYLLWTIAAKSNPFFLSYESAHLKSSLWFSLSKGFEGFSIPDISCYWASFIVLPLLTFS